MGEAGRESIKLFLGEGVKRGFIPESFDPSSIFCLNPLEKINEDC